MDYIEFFALHKVSLDARIPGWKYPPTSSRCYESVSKEQMDDYCSRFQGCIEKVFHKFKDSQNLEITKKTPEKEAVSFQKDFDLSNVFPLCQKFGQCKNKKKATYPRVMCNKSISRSDVLSA